MAAQPGRHYCLVIILKGLSACNPERAVDAGEVAGENHVGGKAAHFREVRGDGSEAAKDQLVHVVLVVGDYVNVFAYFKIAGIDVTHKLHKAGVQLGVKNQEYVAAVNVFRCAAKEFHPVVEFPCKALYTLADNASVQGSGKSNYPEYPGAFGIFVKLLQAVVNIVLKVLVYGSESAAEPFLKMVQHDELAVGDALEDVNYALLRVRIQGKVRTNDIIVKLVQVVVQEKLQKVRALVVVQNSDVRMVSQPLGKGVEGNLLVDGKLVEDYEHTLVFTSFRVCNKEALALFWDYFTPFHKNAIGLFYRLFGDVVLGCKVIHGRKHFSGFDAGILDALLYLVDKLAVYGGPSARINYYVHFS